MIEQFVKFLSARGVASPTVIFDIGARDCLQSVEFSKQYPECRVFSFECNPQTLPLCRQNIVEYSNITLIDKAVNNYDGSCTFYPINPQKTRTTWKDGNPGASSLFRSNNTYPVETYVQDEITSPCVKLSTVMKEHGLDHVDCIWMDLQGAELLALESLEEFLPTVKYIYTEVSHRPIYSGQVLYGQLNDFLVSKGFKRETNINPYCWQEDVIYSRA
jgi:FkbM family methyltransferase